MRSYYRKNPQLDRASALKSLHLAETVLAEFPQSGHKFQDMNGVFEYPINGTPFSMLYTVAHDAVWVIDIRDQRGLRSAAAISAFDRELRRKYGLAE